MRFGYHTVETIIVRFAGNTLRYDNTTLITSVKGENVMAIGKKTWVFADGDLPPQGNEEPFGHEALMVANSGERDAHLSLKILFEDKAPVEGVHLTVPAQRVNCFRMDFPVGEEKFSIPKGQYAVILTSDEPIVALYGRLDRRKDMAYYPIAGFSE
ncbi:MAG: hypothetical protein GX293_13425 [Bacteroidales bacterium]|jgi:hypothetical protein|nr:hypothetical protein [Bacteroidales bacterium]